MVPELNTLMPPMPRLMPIAPALIVPVLVMPPRKVETVLSTKMPVIPAVIAPLLVMPPRERGEIAAPASDRNADARGNRAAVVDAP
jgi:hypothetical protein